ncbi:MAG: PPC domain-containing protein [Planctomyces sp.]|nr:PPC domain-containing protein [Planctomyces sp.]
MAAFFHHLRRFGFTAAAVCSGAGLFSVIPTPFGQMPAGQVVFAQEPVVQRIDSSGLQPGKEVTLTVHGSLLKGATRLWSPAGMFVLKDGQDPNADSGLAFTGTLATDVKPGLYPARVIAPGGCSEGLMLVVDDLPFIPLPAESESKSTPLVLAPGSSVSGALNAVKPRFFQVSLSAGQTLGVEVFARRLSSDLDPVLRVTGPNGREIAFADDIPGLEGDCHFSFKAPSDGAYLLELRDVRYTGSPRHHFHLRVGSFEVPSVLHNPAIDSTASLPMTESVADTEPNNNRETATIVASGTTAVRGRFEQPGDTDWYRITADAAAPFAAFAHTRDAGSAADVILNLWGPDGNKIVETDDTGPLDAQLITSLPAAGEYWLEVRELASRGGSEWTYDLELIRNNGAVEITASADRLQVPRGGSASLVLTVRRVHYDGPLQVEAIQLPQGLTMQPVVLGAKQSTVPVVITAPETPADPAQSEFGPLQFQVTVPGRPERIPAVLRMVPPPPRKKDGDLFRSFRARSDVFVAVRPAAQFSFKPESSAVTVAPGASATVKITATRHADWAMPIDLGLSVPADQLPPGITIPAVKLEGNEVVLTITAAADASPGKFTVFVQGTAKKDNVESTQPVPPIVVDVVKP